jgi:hypothetical protein
VPKFSSLRSHPPRKNSTISQKIDNTRDEENIRYEKNFLIFLFLRKFLIIFHTPPPPPQAIRIPPYLDANFSYIYPRMVCLGEGVIWSFKFGVYKLTFVVKVFNAFKCFTYVFNVTLILFFFSSNSFICFSNSFN